MSKLQYFERKPHQLVFNTGPLCWSNWKLKMLVFAEGGKPENPEKNPRSKAKTNNKINPHLSLGQEKKIIYIGLIPKIIPLRLLHVLPRTN